MRFLLAAVAGVLTWSWLEYMLHRFLGHDRRTMPNFFSVEHTRHHSEGNYFAPTWKKGLLAVAISVVMLGVGHWLVSADVAISYTVAFVTMYMTYELVHRRTHTHEAPHRYAAFLRRHHFHHHFGNTKSNHGVTSPVWDLVFGTFEKPAGQIRVPYKLAMLWLIDPATDDVRTQHSNGYQVVGRPKRS